MDDIYALPDFDDLYETARKADLRFGQREHFGRRNSDRDERNDVRGKVDSKKFQERNKFSSGDSKSSKGMGISLRKKDKENDESQSSVFKTYFTCRNKEGIVKSFITFNGMNDVKFEVGVDTCSEVSILTLKDFDRLNDEMKKKLVSEDWIFTKSWHGSHSKVIGFLEDFIDIDNVNVKSVKAKFYVAEGEMSLIGVDLIRKLGINPLSFDGKGESKVFVDEFGIEYGKKLPRVEEFLKKSSSRVLVDDLFEPGNVLEAEFSVCDSFVPKRAGIIPIPDEYRGEVEEIFKREMKNGWWEEVKSPVYGSIPLIVVPKPDGSLRLVFSCKNINKYVVVPKMSVLPSPKDVLKDGIDTISVIDISNAFRRIDLVSHCRDWLIVGTPFGYFRPTNLIFGFSLSPVLFYQSLLHVLEPYKEWIHVYIDDILISSSLDKHEEILLGVLKALCDVNLKLSTKKCKFMVDKVQFIGYELCASSKSVCIPDDRLQSFLDMKVPNSGKDLKKVLASFNYYSLSIPGYALAVEPLFKYEKEVGDISGKIKDDFMNLLECMAKAMVLNPVDENVEKLVLEVVANNRAISSVLSCKKKNKLSPLFTFGRVLRKSELNYSYPAKLLLVVKETLYAMMPVTCGYSIEVKCEVKNLILDDVLPRTAVNTCQRLLVDLLPFNVVVKYDKMVKDVSLARICKIDLCYFMSELPFSIEMLKECLVKDSNGSILLKGSWGKEDIFNLHSSLRQQIQSIEIVDNVVLIAGRVFIPASLEKEVLSYLHKLHQSYSNMILECRRKFYFLNYVKKLQDMVMQCTTCNILQRNKKLLVVSWPEAMFPRERYHFDVGQVNAGKFFCCVDVFSGFISTRVIKKEDSKSCVSILSDIFQCIGVPLISVSDNARMFTAWETLSFLERLGVKHCFSVANKSQSNGSGERAVGLIKESLVKFLKDGKSFREALNLATLKAQKRCFKGSQKTCADLFFDVKEDAKLQLKKYLLKSVEMNSPVWFKKDRSDKEWLSGVVCERLSDTLYKVIHENKVFVRSIDSIRFIEPVDEKNCKEEEDMKVEVPVRDSSEKLSDNSFLSIRDELKFSETLEARDFKKFSSLNEKVEDHVSSSEVSSESNSNSSVVDSENGISDEALSDFDVVAACDGSALGGKGMAFVISYKGKMWKEKFKVYNKASAQDTEMFGFVLCLLKLKSLIVKESIDKGSKIVVVTDSSYVAKGVNDHLPTWSVNGWKKSSGEILVHADFWKRIWLTLNEISEVKVRWVRGHKRCSINILVDSLAKEGAQSQEVPLSKEDVRVLCQISDAP
uniref:RNA-directed DNA polymerase n=1 Tax=Strongyloides papillosus TaxID=174720 RepID=A0A0N5B3N4_STREA